jgi:tetratricopeptide (TPR) repeat protein
MKKIEELIKNKQFDLVISQLEGQEDETSLKYLVMANFNIGNYDKTIELINLALSKDEKNYYWLIRYKIEAFIESNQLQKALAVVQEELKMPYIPKDYVEYFETLGQQLNNQVKLSQKKDYFKNLTNEDFSSMLLSEKDETNLLVLVEQFNHRNARALISTITTFVALEYVANYIKMALLEILHDQAVDHDFLLTNKGKTIKINPLQLEPLFEQEGFKQSINLIDGFSNSITISQKEIAYELLISYLADNFPLKIETKNQASLVAAVLIFSSQMLSISNNQPEIMHYTGANDELVKGYIQQLKLII